jgi:starch-binding outer membrane protein, SusD/RagB family
MNLFRIISKWVVAALFVIELPLIISCNKLLDAGSPANKVITPQVYTSDSLAQAALIGVYYKMMYSFGPFNGYISRYCGLAADELNRTTTLDADQPFLTNTLTPDNNTIWFIWTNTYSYIYQCNDLIEGLTGANTITPALRNQLLGEAYFLRALSYYYLINLYGEVPLALSSEYTKNTSMPRTSISVVYDKLIEDLINAKNLLTDKYVTTPDFPTARVRVNRLAAQALLARIYLFRGEWANAAAEATAVIESGVYQLETNLAQTFRFNSKEAILQFMTIMDAYNTAEGGIFVPVNPNGRPAFILSDTLMKKIEPGDARRLWIRTVTVSGKQYNSPYKYKLNTNVPREEYNMVLRLAELYCIRAEALTMQDQLADAVSDLNKIRKRAGLPDLTTITTQSQALAAIEQERRVEFFAEWGHRWFDLKRLPARTASHPGEKRIDEVMSICRPSTWKPTAALWPIPGDEIIRNRALIQNEGYN